eukprot:TRINITY_DN152_c0_g1_i1.p1 TRINITY_DN152_c0_g1~~TRINITY_DN152_c0_g1_i1.p1  ORF type:complete len:209 (+),score=74.53 TRINITY_DN152_c0_g1_i1:67-627(+)
MKFLLVLAVAAYAKAEAEAEPGFAYSVGHLPLTYTHAVAPALTYTVPHVNPVVYTVPAAGCQNSEGAFVPCAQGSYFGYVPVAAAAAPAATAEAAPAVEAERKKREAVAEPEANPEADPEADPWLYYSTHGYGYSHYAPLSYSYAPTMEGRRGRLRLSQRLMLILRLTHGCCMEDMEAMDTLTMLL